MLKTPNRPLEMAYPEEGERTYTCYTAPGVVFATEEEMKEAGEHDCFAQRYMV